MYQSIDPLVQELTVVSTDLLLIKLRQYGANTRTPLNIVRDNSRVVGTALNGQYYAQARTWEHLFGSVVCLVTPSLVTTNPLF